MLSAESVHLSNAEEYAVPFMPRYRTLHRITLAQNYSDMSGSDIRGVINDALMAPIRELKTVDVSISPTSLI